MQRVFIKYIFSHHSARQMHSGAGVPLPESQSYVSRLSLEAATAAAAAAGDDSFNYGGAGGGDPASVQIARMHQPVKIIHKEHDAVTAFCINKVS